MRNQKHYIAIDENERRIILNSLNALRNKLLAESYITNTDSLAGRSANPLLG